MSPVLSMEASAYGTSPKSPKYFSRASRNCFVVGDFGLCLKSNWTIITPVVFLSVSLISLHLRPDQINEPINCAKIFFTIYSAYSDFTTLRHI